MASAACAGALSAGVGTADFASDDLLNAGSQQAGSLGGRQHATAGAGSQQTVTGWQQPESIDW